MNGRTWAVLPQAAVAGGVAMSSFAGGVILWDFQDFLLFQKELSLNQFPLLSIGAILVCVYLGFIYLFFPIPLFLLGMLRLGINALWSPHGQPIISFLILNCLSSMRCLIRGEEIRVQTSCFARKNHQHLFA